MATNADRKNELILELKKYHRFVNKSEMNEEIDSAIKELSAANFSFPLNSKKSVIISAIVSIITSNLKQCDGFVISICNMISYGLIGLKAMGPIFNSFIVYTASCEEDFALKLIQFSSSLLSFTYVDIKCSRSLISFVLSNLENPSSIVSETAFASIQQIISSLFEYIRTSKSEVSPTSMRFLNKIKPHDFKKPLCKAAFLILGDLLNLIEQKPAQYLNVSISNPKVIYLLWTIIISNNDNFIKQEPHLIAVVEHSVPLPVTDLEKYPIYIEFLSKFCDVSRRITKSVFSYFVDLVKINSVDCINGLIFLRVLLSRYPSFIESFYANCDHDAKLISALIDNLLEYVDEETSTHPFPFNFDVLKHPEAFLRNNDMNMLKLTLPMEICYFMLSIQDSKLIVAIWERIIYICVRIVRYSPGLNTSIFDSLKSLITTSYNIKLNDLRTNLIIMLCGLITQKKIVLQTAVNAEQRKFLHRKKDGLDFIYKRGSAYETLVGILYDDPSHLADMFSRVFSALQTFEEVDVSADFTAKLDSESLSNCVIHLVRPGKFYLNLLANVLSNSIGSFHSLWGMINEKMINLMSQETSPYLTNLIEIIYSVYDNSNRSFLLYIFKLMGNDYVSQEDRCRLLSVVLSILQTVSSEFDDWDPAISSINPSLCITSENTSNSFSCFSFIVKNRLDVLHPFGETLLQYLFIFVEQNNNVNVSLSAMELLWEIAPLSGHKITYIMHQCLKYIKDSRSSISISAVDTALILPFVCEKQCDDEVFIQILSLFREELLNLNLNLDTSILEKLMHNILHCCLSLYKRFSNDPSFNKFLRDLVGKYSILNMERSITDHTFQFYDEIFAFKDLPSDIYEHLVKSFNDVIVRCLEVENSKANILQIIGRKFSRIFSAEKSRFTEKSAEIWFRSVSSLCLKLDSSERIHLSLLYTLDSIKSLLPLPQSMLLLLTQTLRNCIFTTQYDCVKESLFDILISVVNSVDKSQILYFLQLLNPVLSYKQAHRFVNVIIDKNLKYNTADDNDLYFTSLISIGPDIGNQNIEKQIIELFPYVSNLSQASYIRKANEKSIIKIWSIYCNPGTSTYIESIFNNCFSDMIETIIDLLNDISKDERRMVFLIDFLTEAFGRKEANNSVLIYYSTVLFPKFFIFLSDPRADVKNSVKKFLTHINKDIHEYLKDI